ncbi:hypothetical protein BGZ76_010124 [Entomortierella beljakovae]|nr:hypothetical protein BGZ76_010124 [Entomortierella beljakovae]
MRAFPDIQNKTRLIGYWTSQTLPYLLSHSSIDKNKQGKYLKKTSLDEISDIVDEELNVRNHIQSLTCNVSRQEKAISNKQTERVEATCGSKTFVSSLKSTTFTSLWG